MPIWPIFILVLIALMVGLFFLVKFLASLNNAQGVGVFAMIIGAIGVTIPLLVLIGNSSVNIQLAVLLSGAIIFGCGAIATAIAGRK